MHNFTFTLFFLVLHIVIETALITCISMAIPSFFVSFTKILLGFCLLCTVHKDFVVAGFEEVRVEHDTNEPLTNSSITTAGTGEDGRSELCGTDLSFLGPPYGNMSTAKMVCSPIWNTFVLRVSCFSFNLLAISQSFTKLISLLTMYAVPSEGR